MLKPALLAVPLLIFCAPRAHAQSVQSLIDIAGSFAEKARKETDEAVFYVKHDRISTACVHLGGAINYSSRGIATLQEARRKATDRATIAKIDEYLDSMRAGHAAILDAGRGCPEDLTDYEDDE